MRLATEDGNTDPNDLRCAQSPVATVVGPSVVFTRASLKGGVVALRGIEQLKARDIQHEVLTYRFVKGARAAADALDVPHETVVKSLVFRADDGSFLFALLGGDANVSLRKLGRASGHKHVEAAAPRDAERVTGYQVGGISPLGSRTNLPVYLDETTAAHDALMINAGGRGTLVRLATCDFITLTAATVADFRSA